MSACAICGENPPLGTARVHDGRPYCHDGNTPTCYDQASYLSHMTYRIEIVHKAARLAMKNDEYQLAARLLGLELDFYAEAERSEAPLPGIRGASLSEQSR